VRRSSWSGHVRLESLTYWVAATDGKAGATAAYSYRSASIGSSREAFQAG
jgi:hypothetical protein